MATDLRFRSLVLEVDRNTARVLAVLSRPEAVNVSIVQAAVSAEQRTRKTLERLRESPGDKLGKAEAAHEAVVIRLLQVQATFAAALQGCQAVIGVDPGKRDAIAGVALRVTQPLDPEQVTALASYGKQEMLHYFSTYALPAPERAADAFFYSNACFLQSTMNIGPSIDALSKHIDAVYRRVGVLKTRLNLHLGRPPAARVPEDRDDLPEVLHAAHMGMFRELGTARELKECRRGLWTRLAGMKKSWFGYIANRLCVSALALNAGVALEDGDWGIEERGSKGYWGRTQNRIMASVCPTSRP